MRYDFPSLGENGFLIVEFPSLWPSKNLKRVKLNSSVLKNCCFMRPGWTGHNVQDGGRESV
ncbi:MAG: hypothetical protein C5B49_15770 [Bdellovibrio sp.]|nr:MAG: hypothetical protein C5B49_15770 [Bdellovibrio sp.]